MDPAFTASRCGSRACRRDDEKIQFAPLPPAPPALYPVIPMARFIFITGGVVSSLGKGLMAAALAALLQARGYKVRIRKLDPYLNVDPGTMSPYQHGEVYVTDDGAETDLDLGHYERFTGVPARQADNVTSGRIYQGIIATRAPRRLSRRHRPGRPPRHQRDQGVHRRRPRARPRLPDLRDRRHRRRHRSLPFIEAIRQFRNELGKDERAAHASRSTPPSSPTSPPPAS